MKPTFSMLRTVYPRHSMPRAALYAELGFEALTNEKQYENTCGIRMSYALTKAGDPLRRGGPRINRGPFKGNRIEPSMRNLAKYLAEAWGKPEKYPSAEAEAKIGNRHGVVAFMFSGTDAASFGAQGHIDLVWPESSGFHACDGSCYFLLPVAQ